MSEVLKFKLEHLAPLLEQQMNASLKNWAETEYAEHMEKTDAVTFFHNGVPMVCGGISEYWKGRGHLWCIFNEESKEHFIPTFRAIKAWLTDMQKKYFRIELSVSTEFFQGHRRAKMLGFEMEILAAKKYLPSGETCSIYSLVRD